MSKQYISLLNGNVKCSLHSYNSLKELAELIISHHWSPGVFKDNYRNLDNFKYMSNFVLDIDSGLTLNEAKEMFKEYRHIIATTRSHQQPKKESPPCDRFRVILPLETDIICDADYKCTFMNAQTYWPAIDPQCSDASRMFYKSVEIISVNEDGKFFVPLKYIKSEGDKKGGLPNATGNLERPGVAPIEQNNQQGAGLRGLLAHSTREFLRLGTSPEGWNKTLYKAAKDAQQNGYTHEWFVYNITQSAPYGYLDRQDLITINSAFSKPPKYDLRLPDPQITQPDKKSAIISASNKTELSPTYIVNTENKNIVPTTITSGEIYNDTIKWLDNPKDNQGQSTGWTEIDTILGGLRQSELGILQAEPKTGKTVLIENLMNNLTKQGCIVGFASLEMNPIKQVEPDLYSIWLEKNIRQGVSEHDKAKIKEYIKQGRGLRYFNRIKRPSIEDIIDWIKIEYNSGMRFCFIDHFHKIVYDESSLKEIGRVITELSGIKNELNELFICLIVQPTKMREDRYGNILRVGRSTLRGGAVIFDEADWLINMHGRYWTTETRESRYGQEFQAKTIISYPKNIRELQFDAIRAKPYSDNMGTSIHMQYNKDTMQMIPIKYIKE